MRRPPRRSLQLALPQVPLLLSPGSPGQPPKALAVIACRKEGRLRPRVYVVSGGIPGARVQFPDKERTDGGRWSVERLTLITPRTGRPYYRAAGEIRRLEDS